MGIIYIILINVKQRRFRYSLILIENAGVQKVALFNVFKDKIRYLQVVLNFSPAVYVRISVITFIAHLVCTSVA